MNVSMVHAETTAGIMFAVSAVGSYLGYVPTIVAVMVGIAATVSYSISIYDRFITKCKCKE